MSANANRIPVPLLPESTRVAMEIHGGSKGRFPGGDVIPLGTGDPSFVTPEHIREAAKRAIDEGKTHYERRMDLQEAVADKLRTDNGIQVRPDEVVLAHGAHQAIFQVFQALVNPGDEVLLGTPGSYFEGNTLIRGAVPVYVPLRPERGFRMDPADVEARLTPKTRFLCLTTPEAPAGAVHTRDDLMHLAAIAERHNLIVFSDELYEKINFGRTPHTSIASLPGMAQRTITINGLSKGWAMTGWRVGWAAGPASLIAPVAAIAHFNNISLSAPAYWAGVAALRGPQDAVGEMVAIYARKMAYLLERVTAISGLRAQFPDGTYYLWTDIRSTGLSEVAFTALAQSEGVRVNPGTAFGPGGAGFVRLSCTPSDTQLEEGTRRLARAVARAREFAGTSVPVATS
ncbi:MAG: aminotransferase class I/II-fold pyridoxal phosphate-dependent enzyme [Armatimonadota bacterium]|nr:aminotransferase class I/II-fold pyridoxal phosphate-dependent enzyme [Armatimonadota bacterium]